MHYFILAIALASILLIGCSIGGSVEERQKRAQDILDSTTANITAGIDEAKEAAGELHSEITNTSITIESAATQLGKTAQGVQKGVEKIGTALKIGKEGVNEVRNTIQTPDAQSSSEDSAE
ncbi:MAG TPA: hypothetical protein VJB82_03705 [Candidatus Peribacterales bacterium]|nr:hypothetical protein [Candidatus Peribacterales bacterium]